MKKTNTFTVGCCVQMQTAMESTVTWYDIMEYNEDMILCQSCKPDAVISRCKYNIANMVQFTLLEMKLSLYELI